MDSEDHDYLIRIRQLLESFVSEVRGEFKKIASDRHKTDAVMEICKTDISNLKTELALVKNDLEHMKKDYDCLPIDVKKSIEKIVEDIDDKLAKIDAELKKKIKESQEEADKRLGQWVTLAAVVGALVGTALTLIFTI
jgi:vacuolar-type H+-ATPase subunit E/Vma4